MKKVLSLFSGCGGMDLGFEGGFEVLERSINNHVHPDWFCLSSRKGWGHLPQTGFRTVFSNDIFDAACKAWTAFFTARGRSAEDFHKESIVDLVKKARSGDFTFPSVDLITGGFPCQDFSVSGKRNGFNSHKAHHGGRLTDLDEPTEENRGKLYMWMRNVVESVRPKVFIAENVKGLVSLADAKIIIEKDFRSVGGGYVVVPAKVLYAPDYGVPQTRERVIFYGFRRDALRPEALAALTSEEIPAAFDPYPKKTHRPHDDGMNKNLMSYVTVGEVLKGLPEPPEAQDLAQRSYSRAKWYGNHCQGHTEVDLNGLGPTIRSEHHGNIEFRRLSKAHGGRNLRELAKGMIERRLTVRECARLQTFPDNFEFVRVSEPRLTATEGYKVIGNAVPPLLAYHIARRVEHLWPTLFDH